LKIFSPSWACADHAAPLDQDAEESDELDDPQADINIAHAPTAIHFNAAPLIILFIVRPGKI